MAPEAVSLRPYNPAGWFGRLIVPFFRKVAVDQEALTLLERAYAEGDVVFTLRAKRLVDPTFVLYVLARHGLPIPTWLHDHPLARNADSVEALLANVESSQSSLLFLRRPRTITSRSAYSKRHVEALVELQRRRERPLLLVPVTLQWTRRPGNVRRSLRDAIFGDREAPGAFREMMGFLWRYSDARFHVATPVNLREVVAREEGTPDHVVAKKVRWTILHHLAREEQLRTGPVHRSAARTRAAVRNDPQVRKFIAGQVEQGKDLKKLETDAEAMLQKIAADMHPTWLRVLDVFIDFLWNRIYDGIQVDPEGLKKVRRAARRGPVVVVPSHKSHVDYLVLSQVFFKNDLIPPHIAAGENLDFWPVGDIFRRGGAFFLRRKFRGDKLYTTVFAAYVRRLLKEGHAVEFFIEGGRSRTGKLLPPKLGMLAMCADPVFEGSISDVSFLPVSIGYEKIIEAGAYAKELAGGEKRKEDVTALVSSAKILRSRYGRVYVDFDEPLSLQDFVADRGLELPLPEGKTTKPLVQQLGHRIAYGINRVTRVTPTSVAALVLLSTTRRGMFEAELLKKVARALEFLGEVGARRSSVLEKGPLDIAIGEALGRLEQDRLLLAKTDTEGARVYQLDERGRMALDYYKNNILHYFVPAAIVCASVLAAEASGNADEEQVAHWARRLSRLLKNEVSFRVGPTFEENFDAAAKHLVRRKVLDHKDNAWRVRQEGTSEAHDLAALLAPFFEGYRHFGETLAMLDHGPAKEKKVLDAALTQARRAALDGRISRAEAASQPILRQALTTFLSEEGVVRGEQGSLVAGPDGRRQAVIEELTLLLRATQV